MQSVKVSAYHIPSRNHLLLPSDLVDSADSGLTARGVWGTLLRSSSSSCSSPADGWWSLWPRRRCPWTPPPQSSTGRPGCCSASRCRHPPETETSHWAWEGTEVRDAAVCLSICVCVWTSIHNSQHVSDDAEAPHVCGEWNKLVVDDFRS